MDQDTMEQRSPALSGTLGEIEAVLERARTGAVGEEGALATIERVLRRRGARAETYQKPLG